MNKEELNKEEFVNRDLVTSFESMLLHHGLGDKNV